MALPRVSVVLPTYDRPEALRQATRSVLSQTYGNVELLVVDDHSPTPAASTLEAVEFGDTDVRIVRHEENRGANEARNTGIATAEGEYVAFLDDDDRWRREKLRKQVTAFQRADESVGVVYTGTEYDYGDYTRTVLFTLDGDVTRPLLSGRSIGEFSTLMVGPDVIEAAGALDTRFPSWQDREWLLRLSTHCTFETVEEPLTVRRRASDERSISDNYKQKRDVSYPLFLDKHRDLAASYGREYERAFVGSLSAILGKCALKHGRYADARRYLLKSLYYDPLDRSRWVYTLVSLGGGYAYEPVKELVHAFHRSRSAPTRR